MWRYADMRMLAQSGSSEHSEWKSANVEIWEWPALSLPQSANAGAKWKSCVY